MKYETLDRLLSENGGVLKTADAMAAGITKTHFYEYIKDAGLEKVAHGIYISADTLTDELYLLQAQFPRQSIPMKRHCICMSLRNASLYH